MERIYVDEVAIEVTRRCNMFCDHCLRGDPQNKDIKIEYVDRLLSQIDGIHSLVITGGEPSLVPHKIVGIIDSLKAHNVTVDNFYCVTNGKIVPDAFLGAILRMYAYCSSNEISELAYSNDNFHSTVSPENIKLLEAFSFTVPKGECDEDFLIMEGRAEENFYDTGRWEGPGYYTLGDMGYIDEGIIYLNCNGKIVSSCDLSYKSQNQRKFIVADVKSPDFNLWDSLTTYNEKIDKGRYN